MIFNIKQFKDLSTHELYTILQLRAEIFVVEQDCVYLDLDNKDKDAYHVLGVLDNKIVVLCIPARYTSIPQALKMVETFLETDFEGGRHQNRVNKIPAC